MKTSTLTALLALSGLSAAHAVTYATAPIYDPQSLNDIDAVAAGSPQVLPLRLTTFAAYGADRGGVVDFEISGGAFGPAFTAFDATYGVSHSQTMQLGTFNTATLPAAQQPVNPGPGVAWFSAVNGGITAISGSYLLTSTTAGRHNFQFLTQPVTRVGFVALLDSPAPVTVDFYAWDPVGTLLTHQSAVLGNGQQLDTSFGWDSIASGTAPVSFVSVVPSLAGGQIVAVQLDDLAFSVATVPEASAASLLALAAAGVLARRRRKLLPLALAAMAIPATATTITFKNNTNVISSDGVVQVPNYAGTQDTFITSGLPTSNWGSNIDLIVGDNVPGRGDSMSLIRFDVSALAGQYVHVNSVTLRLYSYINGQNGGGLAGSASRAFDVTLPVSTNLTWGEGNANGMVSPGTASWDSPNTPLPLWLGGDPLALSSFFVDPPGARYVDFQLDASLVTMNYNAGGLTQLITDWAAGNNGGMRVAFTQYLTGGLREFGFGSTENNAAGIEQIPELVIDYDVVPEPGAASLTLLATFALLRRRR